MEIFEFKSYKRYLSERLLSKEYGRGAQSKLSKAIRCQPAFVSQVLKGTSHFSLEQGQEINRFLSHSADKSRYFLSLVQFERAGTKELKKHFESELNTMREDALNFKKRLTYEKVLSNEAQQTYYSSWIYSAIHALVSIPRLQSRAALHSYLRVPAKKTNSVLEFLISHGLVNEKADALSPGITQIHIGKDSPLARQHHINLRHKALQSIELESEATLHYSSLVTMSEEDAVLARSELTQCIERIRKMVKDSKSEEAYCYLVDFFPVL